MRENYIFDKDLVIPDIVQKKAEMAFAKIQAEEIETGNTEDSESKVIDFEKRRKSTKVIKRSLAIAASLAVVIAGTQIVSRNPFAKEETNLFTISVYADEIREGKGAVLKDFKAETKIDTVQSSADTYDKHVELNMGIPILIKGENISKISYSVSKGAFIVANGSSNVADTVSGKLKNMENDIYTGIGYDRTDIGVYDSFTVDYQKQKDLSINLVRYSDDEDIIAAIMYNKDDRPYLLQQQYNRILEESQITVEIALEDGTTVIKTLGIYMDENNEIICELLEKKGELPYSKKKLEEKVRQEQEAASNKLSGAHLSAYGDKIYARVKMEGTVNQEFETEIKITESDSYLNRLKLNDTGIYDVINMFTGLKEGDTVSLEKKGEKGACKYTITILDIEKLYY